MAKSVAKSSKFEQKLQDFLKKTEPQANDFESPLIELNIRMQSNTFYNGDDFNYFYINFINEHISTNNLLTDKNNQWQVQQAMNAIYLDGDWCFSSLADCLKYDELCSSWCAQYTDKWMSLLKTKNINVIARFQFVPTTFKGNKGGFHSFIFCDKNLDVDLRLNMYELIQRDFINDIDKDIKSNTPTFYVAEEYKNDFNSFNTRFFKYYFFILILYIMLDVGHEMYFKKCLFI